MLVNLFIRDLVLIDRLELSFDCGLTVLTGETGAGKSILLDALGLALGARGDAGLVRRGSEESVVTATFALNADHDAHRYVRDLGIPTDDTLILRRHLSSSGRSRAFVNDNPASVGLLREIGEQLIEIEGQIGGRGVLNPKIQRRLLDQFGELMGQAEAVSKAFHIWRTAADELIAERSAYESARREEDLLRHTLAEIDAMAPQADEENALAEQRKILMQGDKLAGAVGDALAALTSEPGVEQRLASARRALAQVTGIAGQSLNGALEALDRSAIEVSEAFNALTAAGHELAPNPTRLEQVEQRLFGLRALARKYGVDMDGLSSYRDRVARDLSALDHRADRVKQKARAEEAARSAFTGACEVLSQSRAFAAEELGRRVTAELAPLKLRSAVFAARLLPLPKDSWSASGAERISFEVVTNPGSDPAEIGSIASGGELARFVLAIKVVLSRAGSAPTLIFDEVDANIGGAVAAAVGDRLARLGKGLQVLAVTHSPQVAARAARHIRVVKNRRGNRSATRVQTLDSSARREEVARMLAGKKVTDEARAAAESLFNGVTP